MFGRWLLRFGASRKVGSREIEGLEGAFSPIQCFSRCVGVPVPPATVCGRGYAHQLNDEFLVEKEGLKARLIDGKKMADTINKEIQQEIQKMVADGNR